MPGDKIAELFGRVDPQLDSLLELGQRLILDLAVGRVYLQFHDSPTGWDQIQLIFCCRVL